MPCTPITCHVTSYCHPAIIVLVLSLLNTSLSQMTCQSTQLPLKTHFIFLSSHIKLTLLSLTFSHFHKDLQASMPNFLVSPHEEVQKPQWSQKLLYAILGLLVQVWSYCYLLFICSNLTLFDLVL